MLPLLDFGSQPTAIIVAGQSALNPYITAARASSGTYFNSAGTNVLAATNEARFDYNPVTLAWRGLLYEGARTNSVRNSTYTGTGGAKSGTGTITGNVPNNMEVNAASGLSVTVSTGTENGLTYYELVVSGTPTASPHLSVYLETSTGIAGATAQTWSISDYIKLTSGSMTNVSSLTNRIFELNGVGTALATGISSDFRAGINADLNRFPFTYTTVGGVGVTNLRPAYMFQGSGAAVSYTVRVYAPQLEQGPFATSFIPTSGTAATRAADSFTISNLASIGFNPTEGTMMIEAECNGIAAAGSISILSINDGTTANRLQIRRDSSNQWFAVNVLNSGAGISVGGGIGSWPIDTIIKIADAYKSGNSAAVADGGTVLTDATVASFSATPTQMQIGRGQGDASTDVVWHIRRIVYYSTRQPNGTMQSITT